MLESICDMYTRATPVGAGKSGKGAGKGDRAGSGLIEPGAWAGLVASYPIPLSGPDLLSQNLDLN